MARSSRAICDGPSSPMLHAGVRADEVDRGVRDGRHADLVVGAGEEGRERRGERPSCPGRPGRRPRTRSCCSAMNISKKRSGYAFLNSSACVELDTSASSATTSGRRRADGDERVAVGLARRLLAAQRVGRQLQGCGAAAARSAGSFFGPAVGLGTMDAVRRPARRWPAWPGRRSAPCRASRPCWR